jgi:hypothetical protein
MQSKRRSSKPAWTKFQLEIIKIECFFLRVLFQFFFGRKIQNKALISSRGHSPMEIPFPRNSPTFFERKQLPLQGKRGSFKYLQEDNFWEFGEQS